MLTTLPEISNTPAKLRLWHMNKNKEYHLEQAFGSIAMHYI
jgi:hypothetical protein